MNVNIRLQIAGDGNRTVARATFIDMNKLPSVMHGLGSSGREPGDKPDREIGESLAMARALHSLASKLEKQAAGKMKHKEEIKRHRKEIEGKKKLRQLIEEYAPEPAPSEHAERDDVNHRWLYRDTKKGTQ